MLAQPINYYSYFVYPGYSAMPQVLPVGDNNNYVYPDNINMRNNYNNYTNEVAMDVELSDCEDIEGPLPYNRESSNFSYAIEDFIVFGGELDESINLLEEEDFDEQCQVKTNQAYLREDDNSSTDNSTQNGSYSGSSDAFFSENNFSELAQQLVEIPRSITLFGGQGVQVFFSDSTPSYEEEIMLYDDEQAIICVSAEQFKSYTGRVNPNVRVVLAQQNKHIIIRRALSSSTDQEIIMPFMIDSNSTSIVFIAE